MMQTSNVTPLPRQAIEFIDGLLAKHLLLAELCQIPEFMHLWNQIRDEITPIMEVLVPHLKGRVAALSPEGRGAVLLSGGEAWRLCGEEAIREVEALALWFNAVKQVLDEVSKKYGLSLDYRDKLKTLVEPLRVPDFVDVMVMWDMKLWGLDQCFSGPVDGFARDLLESQFMKGLTDLSVGELAATSPGRVRQRIKRKAAPLRRHITRYDLRQRIHLWVRNVIYGETQEQIANCLQQNEQWFGVGESPWEWVRKQIHDVNRLLGVRRKGRPRKGGVLRYWKLTIK